jgi:hypothetical protein
MIYSEIFHQIIYFHSEKRNWQKVFSKTTNIFENNIIKVKLTKYYGSEHSSKFEIKWNLFIL